jgi:hypothetical protein
LAKVLAQEEYRMGIEGSFGGWSDAPAQERVAAVVANLPERMRTMPKKEQDELYAMFYTAYILNRESNVRESQKNHLQLHSLQQAWGMSEAHAAMLRAHSDKRIQAVKDYLDAYHPIVA